MATIPGDAEPHRSSSIPARVAVASEGDPHSDAVRRALADYAAHHGPLAEILHTVQMTSFGGSGSTALSGHLMAAGVDLPKTPGEAPFKHQRVPPDPRAVPQGFRVLYPFADPRNAMLSIFRRGRAVGHYRGLFLGEPPTEVAERLSCLDAFLRGGIDDFALEDHIDRWMQPHGFPVMFFRYEALPAAWSAIQEFLGLGRDVPCLAVRPRTSDWRDLSSSERKVLESIYGRLASRLDAMPDVCTI